MQNHKIFYTNAPLSFSTLSLISVYNSHIYGEHHNPFTAKSNDNDMYCMIITLNGSARVVLNDGKEIALQEKSVFFGAHASIKIMHSDCEHWHQIAYWFVPQNINVPVNRVFSLGGLDSEKESDEADAIIYLLQTQLRNKLNYANSSFCCKLLKMLEQIDFIGKNHNDKIDSIILYINKNIETPLSVKDLAQAFHYSEKHIHHMFRTMLNISPMQFISNIKLENICYLLSTTSMSLQELSDKYCYASVSHLINSFKTKFGVTPTAYRNEKQSAHQ